MLPKLASLDGWWELARDQGRCGRGAGHAIDPVDTVGAALAAVRRSNQRLTEESRQRPGENVQWTACVGHLEKLFTEKRSASSPDSNAANTMRHTRTIPGTLESDPASVTIQEFRAGSGRSPIPQ